jgi:hypothetical protein
VRKPEKSVAEIRVGAKVLAFLSRTHWQILIAILVTAATVLLPRQWRGVNAFPLQFTLSDSSFIRRQKRREWAYLFLSAYLLRLFLLRSHGRFIEKRRSYSNSLRARKKMNRHNVIKSAAGGPHRFASSICDFGSSVVSSPGGQRRRAQRSRCAQRCPC